MRWLILVVGTLAMTAGSTSQYGLAYLIPAFRDEGLSLEQTGVLVASPTVGVMLTLIAWGAAADRWGERVVLTTGLGLAGLVLIATRWVHGTVGLAVCLALSGAAGASVLASGRMILRWFARHERALAMGIRQSAGPMGLALAAATLPALAVGGTDRPLLFLAGLFLAAATASCVFVRDPAPQPSTTDPGPAEQEPPSTSPYRTPHLWRVHAASALLVIPQSTITTFALVFLTDARGWTALDAGHLLAGAQVCGALSRLGVGYWSDRTGSRLKPMRIIAVSTGVGMLVLAAAAAAGSSLAVPVLLFLGVLAVSSNGLSFTAVAEHAGPAWAGRALGIQTTGQNVLTAATPPAIALAIGAASFAPSFAVVAAFPLIAAFLVPAATERTATAGQAAQQNPATTAAPGIRS
ncbi:MFS transporter [Actinoplanes regularis]|uniref:Sugar phosphate permease n=1 Tax=Actinoplanes regularis TaxID=52697 RepID=A0A239BWD2_9ACTN|nr:MFS transporter [Actinoplanes regularis]GIE88267.1 MFS transporter [Actinoplanes regularis]SNS11738.1 Sugar phosphate permease [Actinoplanes regularis]